MFNQPKGVFAESSTSGLLVQDLHVKRMMENNGPPFRNETDSKLHKLALAHGLYFLITGIWPIVHMPTFITLTGPKDDLWLVNTVGMLVTVMGITFIAAFVRKHVDLPIIMIAIGSALGFIFIDIGYVARNVISAIYLLDAVVQIILLIAWASLLYKKRNP